MKLPRSTQPYILVKREWKYLYRAVDSKANTLDFMLSGVINVDTVDKGRGCPAPNNLKNAAYPKAIDELKKDQTLTKTTELRRAKYLNNIVEQNHRFIKRLVNSGMGFNPSIPRGEH